MFSGRTVDQTGWLSHRNLSKDKATSRDKVQKKNTDVSKEIQERINWMTGMQYENSVCQE